LSNALAEKHGIDINNIIIGSGSTELIRMIALAYFGTGDSVLIPQPTYSEYEVTCNLTGAKVLKQPVRHEPYFQLNISECLDSISKNKPKGIFLCNPNNPTGQYLNKDEIEKILKSARDSLIIIDEAYIAFTKNAWSSSYLLNYDNVVIIRSMTKDYALAGIRLGYAIANESIISILKRVRAPWNVSTIAQKAGILAIKNDVYLKECTTKIQESKKYLEKELKILGLTLLPSSTNFFMIKVNNATQFRQSLLEKGVLVRDCTSFGLPNHIRLGARSLNDCEKLIEAIKTTGV
jgi:histidinol-phosphate aminotransferase